MQIKYRSINLSDAVQDRPSDEIEQIACSNNGINYTIIAAHKDFYVRHNNIVFDKVSQSFEDASDWFLKNKHIFNLLPFKVGQEVYNVNDGDLLVNPHTIKELRIYDDGTAGYLTNQYFIKHTEYGPFSTRAEATELRRARMLPQGIQEWAVTHNKINYDVGATFHGTQLLNFGKEVFEIFHDELSVDEALNLFSAKQPKKFALYAHHAPAQQAATIGAASGADDLGIPASSGIFSPNEADDQLEMNSIKP